MSAEESTASSDELLRVFWRPGCSYCERLFRVLEREGIRHERHDIWRDETARGVVAALNGGNETVPTVVVGDRALTNPGPDDLVALLRAEYPELFATIRHSR